MRSSLTISYVITIGFSLQVEVKEGDLVCPDTGRKFPITNGIPNMLLTEDEVE